MKKFKSILLAAMLITLALTFFACSSDDGGDGTSSGAYSSSSEENTYSCSSGDANSSSSEISADLSSSSSDETYSSSSENFENSSSGFKFSSSSAVSSSSKCTAKDNDNTQYCSNGTMKEYGSTPEIGGRTYKTVAIGSKIWTAENLNYETTTGSYCYENDESKCAQYGRLYDKETAISVCPSGWHLPTLDEWKELERFVAGSGFSSRFLKATSGWDNCSSYEESYESFDTYGFAALPGGGYFKSSFHNVGCFGYWWSATSNVATGNSSRIISYTNSSMSEYFSAKGEILYFSVRCVKD